MARGKYAQLPDLFVTGTELVFDDKTVMWLQVLNPFEIDEARKDASVARSRLTIALKEFGSPDHTAMIGAFKARSTESVIDEMLTVRASDFFTEASNGVQNDSEWAERLEIARRFDSSPPVEEAETKLLEQINRDYMTEVIKRTDDERAYAERTYAGMSDDELQDEYEDLWLKAKGQDVGIKAFNTAEIYYGARCCEAVPTQDGYFTKQSHVNCNHDELVFESKDEVRQLPEALQDKLREGFKKLAMSERDARFSRRQESSSASSPLPSAEVESAPSTPAETSSTAPGT